MSAEEVTQIDFLNLMLNQEDYPVTKNILFDKSLVIFVIAESNP